MHVQAMPSLLDPCQRATYTGARRTPRQPIRDPRNASHKTSSVGGASMDASCCRPSFCTMDQVLRQRPKNPVGEKATYNKQDLSVHVRTSYDKLGAHLRESAHVNDCGMKATSNHQKPRLYIEGHERSWSTNDKFTPRPNVNHWNHR